MLTNLIQEAGASFLCEILMQIHANSCRRNCHFVWNRATFYSPSSVGCTKLLWVKTLRRRECQPCKFLVPVQVSRLLEHNLLCLMHCQFWRLYRVAQKTKLSYFVHIFAKYWPIFTIFFTSRLCKKFATRWHAHSTYICNIAENLPVCLEPRRWCFWTSASEMYFMIWWYDMICHYTTL